MEPYRILVVDDSPFMRAIFSDLITRDSEFAVIGTAGNGEEAVEAVKRLKPDAVTLDLEMPLMNGLEALQIIMKESPTPVIMLSGISEQNMRETIKALQHGAFDFIRKPTSAVSDDIQQVGELLIEKLKMAVMTQRKRKLAGPAALPPVTETARMPDSAYRKPAIKLPEAADGQTAIGKGQKKESKAKPAGPSSAKAVVNETTQAYRPATTAPNAGAGSPAAPAEPAAAENAPKKKSKPVQPVSFRHIVAIGTSTGGPRALHEVISSLPEHLPAPVLVVQHMPPKFTRSLAQRLDSFSRLKVVEAEQGEKVLPGVVYIAPGGSHMELSRDKDGYCIKLTQEPPRGGHRPAVDVLFESLVPFKELQRHAVIMTGMGSDGAKGMEALAKSGAASTIAEAEETCVVYGMPRCAVENGSAQAVVPLQQIAPSLVHNVSK
ncbi:chemotaxis response regulator protein-glutamate methylesterase [Paenibacillus thailandensis]|uniref:Protein-glutamate methylesterase/protein-glutamine glutaminase n=1 Tax=Paenibacillus thailandensis TaxID=393250 RepID=A0ABW5QX52_9BACL